jgi:type II secretory pathway component GspD/PulD (secretin)
LVQEPQVVVVESTNSLLVNATIEQHEKIARILEYVDSEMDETEIPYKIYPLENSSPKHLSEILEGLIQETVEQQKEGGKIERTVVSRDEKIKIVPDPNTYSLIVYGNKKNQEWIASLVKQLDKRRPQVLIDCTLVEVTKNDAFNFDLQLTKNFQLAAPAASPADPNSLGKSHEPRWDALTAFYGDKRSRPCSRRCSRRTTAACWRSRSCW